MARQNTRVFPALVIAALCSITLPGPLSAQQTGDTTMENRVTVEQIQSELSDAFAAIGAYTMQERDEALDLARTSLGRVDHEIDVLEQQVRENWHAMTQDAQEETSQAMRTLRERRNRIGELYGAMTNGTEAAWGEMKHGFAKAWEALKSAWSDAAENARARS